MGGSTIDQMMTSDLWGPCPVGPKLDMGCNGENWKKNSIEPTKKCMCIWNRNQIMKTLGSMVSVTSSFNIWNRLQ